jgi:CheY-like chemotaxis protein
LVVDDEAAIKAMIQKSIEVAGFFCPAVQSGEQALALLE